MSDLSARAREFARIFTDHAVLSVAGKQELRQLLTDLADALEAAQRPPLGYVVLAKRESRLIVDEYRYAIAGDIWPDIEPCEDHQVHSQMTADADPERYKGVEYVLAEVREVQP